MRLLIWLALAVIVYFAIRSKVRAMQNNLREAAKAEFAAQAAMQKQPGGTPENMVQCAHCQIYLPASEAVQVVTPALTEYFCSQQHLLLHASGADPTSSANSPSHRHEQ